VSPPPTLAATRNGEFHRRLLGVVRLFESDPSMFKYLNSALPVLLPLVFILAVEWIFLWVLRRRGRSLNFFELGVFYSGIVLIYSLFPCIEFLAGGLSFSVLSDYRLYRANPSPAEAAPIFWYYAIYLACFVVAYQTFRSPEPAEARPVTGMSRKLLWVLVAAYACTYLFFAALKAIWNLQTPNSYSDTYLLYSNLPPAVQFFANHMIGVALLLQLGLMAYLVLHYTKYKRYIYLWLLAEFVGMAVFGVGSRTGMMVLLLALAITYSTFVKRLSLRMVSSFGLVLLVLFVSLGIARSISSAVEERDYSFFGSSNEFDALFANAYDLDQLKAAGKVDEIFPQIYFVDLTRLFPDQLFRSAHLDPSDWYVQNFYREYADQGGGFAFGAISESIVGFGWFDVIWRGLLVGWAFGAIQRMYVNGNHSYWSYAFYLWATVFSYQTFRVTTLNLLPRALGMLLLWWCGKLALNFFRAFQPNPTDLDSTSTAQGF
jgi:oligosaccharide repeat unit polymerase